MASDNGRGEPRARGQVRCGVDAAIALASRLPAAGMAAAAEVRPIKER